MNSTELRELLMDEGQSSRYEALVSVDSSSLLSRYEGDRDAFYQEKSKLIQQLADRIKMALPAGATVDVFEDVGQIVVSADVECWLGVLKSLETLENNSSLRARFYPNEKFKLLH
jgi:hypothetical protein